MKKTLVEICALLNKHKVDYLLIGGFAVVYHGYSRSSNDLDFWYKPTISNFQKIIEAFREYGIDVSELDDLVFDPEKTFLRFPVSGTKAEFLPIIPGALAFNSASAKAEVLNLENTKILVIGYKDLIESKSSSNRLKDQADVEELRKRQKGAR